MTDKSSSSSTSNSKTAETVPNIPKSQPGEGIRSMKSTPLFRAVNFELYAKPNIVVMSIGALCFATAIGYMAYMRYKYESLGYYAAQQEDGTEIYAKKTSKWD